MTYTHTHPTRPLAQAPAADVREFGLRSNEVTNLLLLPARSSTAPQSPTGTPLSADRTGRDVQLVTTERELLGTDEEGILLDILTTATRVAQPFLGTGTCGSVVPHHAPLSALGDSTGAPYVLPFLALADARCTADLQFTTRL